MISSFNLKENYWKNDEYLIPIIKTSGEFHQPVKSGDEITVHLYVSQLKNHSFELNYEWLNEAGESVASAKTVHVIVDKETWQKKNINEDILKGLQRHQKN